MPTAIGAVVVGKLTGCHTPLSGHFEPLHTIVPKATDGRRAVAGGFGKPRA